MEEACSREGMHVGGSTTTSLPCILALVGWATVVGEGLDSRGGAMAELLNHDTAPVTKVRLALRFGARAMHSWDPE